MSERGKWYNVDGDPIDEPGSLEDVNQQSSGPSQQDQPLHLVEPEAAEVEDAAPQFVDVCLYLADQMQAIVSLRSGVPNPEDNDPDSYAYAPVDRIAAAQVWLNAAGALHNAQMQERMQMEVMRQHDLLAKAQGGQGLFVPIGMAPPPGIKH